MKASRLRRDPVSPCADFWHALRVGGVIAVLIFVAVTLYATFAI